MLVGVGFSAAPALLPCWLLARETVTDGKIHGGQSGLDTCGSGWDWKKPVGEVYASQVLWNCTVTESQEPTEDAQDPGLQTDGDRDGAIPDLWRWPWEGHGAP